MFEDIVLWWHLKRLRSHLPSNRIDAVKALNRLRDPRAVEPLIESLADIAPVVRRKATETLGQMGDRRAVEPIMRALKDVDKDVKRLAAEALAVLGDSRAVDPLIVLLREGEREVKAAAAQALGQLGDPRAAGPLSDALRHGNQLVVSNAVDALVQLGPESTDFAVDMLQDSNKVARHSAATVLERVGWNPADSASRIRFAIAKGDFKACVQEGPAAVDLVLSEFQESVGSRSMIARTLGELGDARAVEPLIAALRDPDYLSRVAAVEALANLGDARAIGPLTAVLDDKNKAVSQAAASALKGWKSSNALTRVRIAIANRNFSACVTEGAVAVEPLIAAFKSEHDENMRNAAVRALVELGTPSVEPLIAALQDSYQFVREMAAKALGELKDARAVEPLIAALRQFDSFTIESALVQLGPQSVEPLIAVLHDSDGNVWNEAARVLKRLGWLPPDASARVRFAISARHVHACIQDGAAAVEPLIASLAAADRNAQEFALKALVRLGPHSVEPLIASLLNVNRDVRRLAVKALGQLGDPRAIEPLCVMLRDGDEFVRDTSAETLGQLGDTRAVEPLIAALRTADWRVCMTVAMALGQLGDVRAVEPLIARLKDADSTVSTAVIKALGQLGDVRAVEPLIATLQDADSTVSTAAIKALGQLGDVRAAEWLSKALDDSTGEKRRAAIEALCTLRDGPAVTALVMALKHRRADVRTGAAGALLKIGEVGQVSSALEDSDESILKAALDWVKGSHLADLKHSLPIPAMLKAQDQARMIDAWRARHYYLLVPALRNSRDHIRWRAAEAMKELGWEPANSVLRILQTIASLRKRINSAQEAFQAEIAEIAEIIRVGEVALDPLLGTLKDSDRLFRLLAARALGELGDPRAVDSLFFTATKTSSFEATGVLPEVSELAYVSCEASIALTRYDSERGCKALVKCLCNPSLRTRALTTLRAHGWKPDTPQSRIYCAIEQGDFKACLSEGAVAVGPLIDEFRTSVDDDRCQSVICTLIDLGAHSVEPLISDIIHDRYNFNKNEMRLFALKKIGAPSTDALIASLRTHLPLATLGYMERLTYVASRLVDCETLAQWSDSQLRWLTAIEDREESFTEEVEIPKTHYDGYTTYDKEKRTFLKKIDLSVLRQLARQELLRRGEKA